MHCECTQKSRCIVIELNFQTIPALFFTILHSSVQGRFLPGRGQRFRLNIYMKLELDVRKYSLAY